MKRRAMVRNTVLVAGGLLAVGLIAWPVYAHCGDCAGSGKTMVSAMEAGKSTLAKAIEAAEESSKGKAVHAACEMEGKTLTYEVYCMVGDKIMEVTVDAAGKATGSKDSKTLGRSHGRSHGHDHK